MTAAAPLRTFCTFTRAGTDRVGEAMGGERRPTGRLPRLAGINLPEGLAAGWSRARTSREGAGAAGGATAARGAEEAATETELGT